MAPKLPNLGIHVGLNRVHVVTRKELVPRLSDRKGKSSKRILFVWNLVREVAGFAPYEKRITELLKVGKDERISEVANRKLGTHKRSKKKRAEMSNVLRKMRSGEGAERQQDHVRTRRLLPQAVIAPRKKQLYKWTSGGYDLLIVY